MKFYSTSSPALRVSGQTAITSGLAPDGGLFMPESVPQLPRAFLLALDSLTLPEIAEQVLGVYLADDIEAPALREIARSAFDFPAPLREVSPGIEVLELFHGPTLAFKDFGARFLARALGYFRRGADRPLTVIVATSGDTGGAVAHGFHRVPGIDVVVLYPSGQVSVLQEKQLTTLGDNVRAVEVEGSFDDCQRLAKECFADPGLRARLELTSANSINIGRLLPQMLYYFAIGKKQAEPEHPLVVSVPSGNFGNLTACVLAKRMGLDIAKIIAATNANDVFVRYLASGRYEPGPSLRTISNAMDVGSPSNLARLRDLYRDDVTMMREDIAGFSITDEETYEAMRSVAERHGYLLDPHGAVAYLALVRHVVDNPASRGVFLETAHPAKFADVVKTATGRDVELPPALASLRTKEVRADRMPPDLSALKEILL